MRLIIKTTPEPKFLDIKRVTRFAFFPVRINDETVIWWERYFDVYEYVASLTGYEWRYEGREFYKK